MSSQRLQSAGAVLATFGLLSLSACDAWEGLVDGAGPFEPPPGASAAKPRAKRVILFIGDGMGIPVVTAARIFAVGEAGSLTIDTLPETAFIRTYSEDAQVADSAPTASAYMTGVSMRNGVIAMSSETLNGGSNGKPVTTFLELAEAGGLSTGVVTTTRVTHATPASAYAHISDRDREDDIAVQLAPGAAGYNPALGDGLEVIFGGGQRHFLPATVPNGGRTDGRDLVRQMVGAGYQYASDSSSFNALSTGGAKAMALFTKSHMSYELDRSAAAEPSLAEMSVKAVDILSRNRKGYFLMIEGGRIDHALHETNAKRALIDAVAFDDALKAVLAKVRQTDPDLTETLIAVTADHDHTMVLNGYARRTGPTTATEPGILGLVKSYVTGLPTLDADGVPYSILGFGNGENRPAGNRATFAALSEAVTGANDYHQEAAIRMPLGSETHGGSDVAFHAIGRGAEHFHGFLHNTEVFARLVKAATGL